MEFPFSGQLASSMKPKERLMSISLTEVVATLVQRESYHRVAEIANRVFHRSREDCLIAETVKARCISMGSAISSDYMSEARAVLEKHGADPDTGIIGGASALPDAARNPNCPDAVTDEQAAKTVEACNEGRSGRECLVHMDKVCCTEASAEGCVYISVDDVGVKHQKEERKSGKPKEHKYVENTVIHVQCGQRRQTLTAVGMGNAFRLLVAFLLANRLMEDRRLIFITDGARDIKENIAAFFGFRTYALILDWLHLKKKCKEYLSMAVKGCGKNREERREDKAGILRCLLRILWAGNTQEAIDYLNTLDAKNVSNKYWLGQLTEYIDRKQENIACYAFRHKLGLRVSSNRVEKANDLLVANRQKHNGMSWSEKGSGALAAITALEVNGILDYWLRGGKRLMTYPNAA